MENLGDVVSLNRITFRANSNTNMTIVRDGNHFIFSALRLQN